ncbi:MAG: serine/threonine-protein phosphatase [Erysipelotrichales bacterium]|nr:serine/threonine-protein phosphatase [Erysipelotrichales bacterium]
MEKSIDRWTYVFLLLLSLISVLFNRSFSINPFMLIALYFSFYKGLKSYLFNLCAMLILSFAIEKAYALEIAIVGVSFLFITCLFSYLFRKPEQRLSPIIILNFFCLIGILFINFSLENLVLLIINTIFQIAIIKSIEDFWYEINSNEKKASSLSKSIILMFFAIMGTFFEPTGLLTLRMVLLLVALKLKNEVGILSIFLSCIYCAIFLDYSFLTLTALFLPLVLVFTIKRFEIPLYVVSSVILLLFAPTPIYLNISLYLTIITAIIALSLNKENTSAFFELFAPTKLSFLYSEKNYLAYTNGQIEALRNYVSLIDVTKEENIKDPFDHALHNIRSSTCAQCEHYQFCKLKNNLASLFDEKISSSNKKIISETCITPYKLTLAIETYYKVYKSEKMYYAKFIDANKRYKFLVKSIESPLKKCTIKFNYQNQNSIERKIIESNLHYYQLYMKNNDIYVVFNLENYEDNMAAFDDFIEQNTDTKYNKIIKPQNVLTSTITIIYQAVHNAKYDIGIVSKAFIPPYNGDNYFINNNGTELFVCLCDGMGHGKQAEECSKYLLSAIQTHLKLSTGYADMVNDLNNIMLMKNTSDNYSTMDFFKLNLSSLKGTFIKAGAFLSYVVRNREIIPIAGHNLPLGIVSDCTYQSTNFQFEKGDILVLLTDGIGERVEIDNKILLINNEGDMNNLARNIFNILNDKCKFGDDSTIITIQIL